MNKLKYFIHCIFQYFNDISFLKPPHPAILTGSTVLTYLYCQKVYIELQGAIEICIHFFHPQIKMSPYISHLILLYYIFNN